METDTLSLLAMEKLLKKSGAHRISDSAKVQLRMYLEDIGKKIGEKAVLLAKHSHRKTVRSEDIKLAIKVF